MTAETSSVERSEKVAKLTRIASRMLRLWLFFRPNESNCQAPQCKVTQADSLNETRRANECFISSGSTLGELETLFELRKVAQPIDRRRIRLRTREWKVSWAWLDLSAQEGARVECSVRFHAEYIRVRECDSSNSTVDRFHLKLEFSCQARELDSID